MILNQTDASMIKNLNESIKELADINSFSEKYDKIMSGLKSCLSKLFSGIFTLV